MAREIVEKFICDRTGKVEIRPAGVTLDNMEGESSDEADFFADLKTSSGERYRVEFHDLCDKAKDDVLSLLQAIESPGDAPISEPEERGPKEKKKPKRSRRTMEEITRQRLQDLGMLESFEALSDQARAEYVKEDKECRKRGEDPLPLSLPDEAEEEEAQSDNAPEEGVSDAPEEEPEEGDFF